MNDILDQNLKIYRGQIDEIVEDLHALTKDIGHSELEKTVGELRERINDPYMFVIVGEVKAGKSSFINALLDTDKEICKVAASPMTDTIQQIVYGEEEEITAINPFLKKIYQPVDILREIAIVDTPGTNTIVEHHQEITESFIPSSDLIVFVFEAKNPYRESAWAFFDYIHSDWRKKIIFVLQQKDLMVPEDLTTNIQGVIDQAIKKGIEEPLVFAVSAKQELNGEKEISGFIPVRSYIQENITGGKAPLLKLKNNIELSENINQRIDKGLEFRKKQWNADVNFRGDINETLDEQSKKSNNQVDILVENLLSAYDRTTRKTEDELSEGLGFFSLMKRSLSSIFNRNASAKVWLEDLSKDLEVNLNRDLKDKLNEGVIDIADSIQQMARIIDLKIRNSHAILESNHDIFSDIADRRVNVIQDLQESFKRFMSRSENFTGEELFPEKDNISPNLATGSGIAVIGVILTAVSNGVVFDITGGILTTVGLLFAGVTVGLQRRKVISGYRQEIENGKGQLKKEVAAKLKAYVKHIQEKIDQNFAEFDNLIVSEEQQINALSERHANIQNKLEAMKDKIDS